MNWKSILAAGAILFSGTLFAQTINITCLTPNGGFYIDWQNFTVLTQGQSADFSVQPQGSTVELWSCGDTCRWRSYDVLPGSVWSIFDEGAEGIGLQEVLGPEVACVGFEPPMANYPVTAKKNRVLPLKAELFDSGGFIVLGDDLTAPPVLQVWQGYGTATDDDVSDDALPAGQGTEGNQFVFTDDLKWQFNLKTSNYTGPGTYTVMIESGNRSEYVIEPSCITEFVIK
jgi:hypothetical protein